MDPSAAVPPLAESSWMGSIIWAALIAIAIAAVLHLFLFSESKDAESKNPSVSSKSDSSTKPATKKSVTGAKVKIGDKTSHHHAVHHHPHHHLDLNTLKGHGDAVSGIAFTSDGRGLATACADRVVRVFKLEDVASKSFKFLRINMPTGVSPTAVAFGDGASQLAVATVDAQGGGLCMFAATGGKAASDAREQGKLPPPEIKWEKKASHGGNAILTLMGAPSTHGSADGSVLLATCSEATDAKLWAVGDGKCVATVDSNQLKNTMATLSPNGRFLAIAAFTADVKIWEVVYEKSGSVKELSKVMQLKGHKSAVTWLSFMWDSQRIVTASKEGTIKIWNINVRYHLDEDPKCLHTFQIPELPGTVVTKKVKGPPHYDQIAISPNNSILAASWGHSLQWLSAETGEVLDTAENAHEGTITSMVWAPKPLITVHGPKMILATGSIDKKVKLWLPPENSSQSS